MSQSSAVVTHFPLVAAGLAIALFLAMLLFLEIGRRIGVRRAQTLEPGERHSDLAKDTAVYAVLALLLGFTFSGATTRFDGRRQLVIQESGTMTTSWQRIASLPTGSQPAIRDALRRYTDAVIGVHTAEAGSPIWMQHAAAVTTAQDDLWARAVAASITDTAGEKARMLLLPSLNEMFDVVDQERLASRVHPPAVIWIMLGIAAIATALFAGFGFATGAKRDWLHILGTAATISIVMYVILELEYPRLGIVRANRLDSALIEARATMR